ncbi:MAG: DUF4037 domain-containing protein [Lachnospiraceae bacterium]|nr:DUF4037 domain-containing protein [Lachnospiraceae bacterium]
MNGIELSRSYYDAYGPELLSSFEDLKPFLCTGLFGSGSECMGFDDEISRDHDFEPGFCIFVPEREEIDRKRLFQLERAYAKLPAEHAGFTRAKLSPVGGSRHGVILIPEFFTEKTGSPDGKLSLQEWLAVPEQGLLEAVNGAVFDDFYGEVSAIRERLSYYPEDIRLKKLAGHLLLMAQAGQYNYRRCIAHGEKDAAQLSAFEFVKHTISVIFLLNRQYEPYYKWSFRALRALPVLSLEAEVLQYLITTDNEEKMAEEKADVIESIAADVIDELIRQGLTKANCGDLEKHAYSVEDQIADGELRNLHILGGIA